MPLTPLPGATCPYNRRLISRWLYPMINGVVRYVSKLHDPVAAHMDFVTSTERSGVPISQYLSYEHGSFRATMPESITQIEGPTQSFSSLLPQFPSSCVPPSVLMYCLPPALTTTVHLFFDAPGERARRTALQTHAPPELEGRYLCSFNPSWTCTPLLLLPCWA